MGIIAKNDLAFFDAVAESMQKPSFELKKKIQATWGAFMLKPRVNMVKRIQAIGVSTDLEKITADAFNVTVDSAIYDLGYEQAYQKIQLGRNQDFWEIYDVTNGLTFRKVVEGERIQLEGISGSKVTAYVDYYGGAIGWTDKMIRYRKIGPMVQLASIFRNRFYSKKANVHYALLAAAAALNITTYQGAAADGELRRDIETINLAAYTLTNRVKDKGYDPQNMAEARLLLYANPKDRARIRAAQQATASSMAQVASNAAQVDWNITPIFTYDSNVSSGSPILVLPGNHIQAATDMEPTTFTSPKDPLTLNELQAVWSIYGATVADTDQCQQVTLS